MGKKLVSRLSFVNVLSEKRSVVDLLSNWIKMSRVRVCSQIIKWKAEVLREMET